MDKKFAFNLGDRVKLIESDEEGEVIGRAEYKTGPNSYYLRYKCGDGRQITSWWNEEHLEKPE